MTFQSKCDFESKYALQRQKRQILSQSTFRPNRNPVLPFLKAGKRTVPKRKGRKNGIPYLQSVQLCWIFRFAGTIRVIFCFRKKSALSLQGMGKLLIGKLFLSFLFTTFPPPVFSTRQQRHVKKAEVFYFQKTGMERTTLAEKQGIRIPRSDHPGFFPVGRREA